MNKINPSRKSERWMQIISKEEEEEEEEELVVMVGATVVVVEVRCGSGGGRVAAVMAVVQRGNFLHMFDTQSSQVLGVLLQSYNTTPATKPFWIINTLIKATELTAVIVNEFNIVQQNKVLGPVIPMEIEVSTQELEISSFLAEHSLPKSISLSSSSSSSAFSSSPSTSSSSVGP